MAEFNLAAELERLAPSLQGQPAQSYESSMKTMGNMETARQKHEELKALFQDMIEFKNMKAAGQIPQDYKMSVENLQAWHKETAPSLSEQEFQNVIATFKDVIGGSSQTTQQTSPDAPQSNPMAEQGSSIPLTQPEASQGGGNGIMDFMRSDLGAMLIAAVASMGNAPSEYNMGGRLSDAMDERNRMKVAREKFKVDREEIDARKQERSDALKTRLQEHYESLAQRKEAQDALIEQRKLDREARIEAAKELARQKEADRAQRAADAADRRAQSQQFHNDNLQLRKDMMELSKTKMSRIPPAKAQEVGAKIQGIQRYADLGLSFNDKYAGSVIGGPTVTAISERLGKNKDRVNWWKNFKMLDVKLRNDLFGATLTNNEQKSWDSVTVSENSSPEFVKQAMITRAKIAQDALNRELESYSDAGYDVNKLKGSANRPLPKF